MCVGISATYDFHILNSYKNHTKKASYECIHMIFMCKLQKIKFICNWIIPYLSYHENHMKLYLWVSCFISIYDLIFIWFSYKKGIIQISDNVEGLPMCKCKGFQFCNFEQLQQTCIWSKILVDYNWSIMSWRHKYAKTCTTLKFLQFSGKKSSEHNVLP